MIGCNKNKKNSVPPHRFEKLCRRGKSLGILKDPLNSLLTSKGGLESLKTDCKASGVVHVVQFNGTELYIKGSFS